MRSAIPGTFRRFKEERVVIFFVDAEVTWNEHEIQLPFKSLFLVESPEWGRRCWRTVPTITATTNLSPRRLSACFSANKQNNTRAFCAEAGPDRPWPEIRPLPGLSDMAAGPRTRLPYFLDQGKMQIGLFTFPQNLKPQK